jgi:hypothetical protein
MMLSQLLQSLESGDMGAQLTEQELEALKKRISDLAEKALAERDKAVKAHPNWKSAKDERIVALAKFYHATWPIACQMDFLLTDVSKGKLASRKLSCAPAKPDQAANSFADSCRVSLGLFIHQCTEGSIRGVCRALDPTALNGATKNYKSVYDHVLDTILATKPAESTELLDLLRTIRNTVHNNGTYLSPSGSDYLITYQGKSYDFKHGQAADHATFDLLVKLAEDVFGLLLAVMNDRNVVNYAGDIVDLSQ